MLAVLVRVDGPGLERRPASLLVRGFLLSGGCFWAGRGTRLPPISRVGIKHMNLHPWVRLLTMPIPTLMDSSILNPSTTCYIADTAVQGRWSIN